MKRMADNTNHGSGGPGPRLRSAVGGAGGDETWDTRLKQLSEAMYLAMFAAVEGIFGLKSEDEVAAFMRERLKELDHVVSEATIRAYEEASENFVRRSVESLKTRGKGT